MNRRKGEKIGRKRPSIFLIFTRAMVCEISVFFTKIVSHRVRVGFFSITKYCRFFHTWWWREWLWSEWITSGEHVTVRVSYVACINSLKCFQHLPSRFYRSQKTKVRTKRRHNHIAIFDKNQQHPLLPELHDVETLPTFLFLKKDIWLNQELQCSHDTYTSAGMGENSLYHVGFLFTTLYIF